MECRRGNLAALEHQIAEVGVEREQVAAFAAGQRKDIAVAEAGRCDRNADHIVPGGDQPSRRDTREVFVQQKAAHAEAESVAFAGRMNESSLRQSRTKAKTACRSSGFKCG